MKVLPFKGKISRLNEIKEKIKMYDLLAANLYDNNILEEPEEELSSSQISIGFSSIASNDSISKFYIIDKFPDYIPENMFNIIRNRCIEPGVKINFITYSKPHKIMWDSAEMKNRVSIWKEYTKHNKDSDENVFEYRHNRQDILAKERILRSTYYFNKAELDYKRTLSKCSFTIQISCNRDSKSIKNMGYAIQNLREFCIEKDIIIREVRTNVIDWLNVLWITSLKQLGQIQGKLIKKVVSDDILANFNSYKQGTIGNSGICLAVDVDSKGPILKNVKPDPDTPENWLIAGVTGCGKSLLVKFILTQLLGRNYNVTVTDYEGDEYLNLGAFIKSENPDDVLVVSMGKGSALYFDPVEIPELTGDPKIDDDLKDNSQQFITTLFRVMNCGPKGKLNQWEERVITEAIKRVYTKARVTEEKSTWKNSRGLILKDVYLEIKEMAINKEFIDETTDNIKHKAATKIYEGSALFFEEGEAKAGTFKQPMSASSLFGAKLVIFAFGLKGAEASQIDPTILALKQLSVAHVSNQISNHCKYVLNKTNVRIWEEFQRWSAIEGSDDIIINAITGGRKRSEVNIILTNVLSDIMSDSRMAKSVRGNLTTKIIGAIADREARENFCRNAGLQDIEKDLEKIYKAFEKAQENKENVNSIESKSENKYTYSFCMVLDGGKTAIGKVAMPQFLLQSKLFSSGRG